MEANKLNPLKKESYDNKMDKNIGEKINNYELNKEIEEEFKCLNDELQLDYKEEYLFKIEYNKDNINNTEEKIKKNDNKEKEANEENMNEIIMKDNKENFLLFSPILSPNKNNENNIINPKDAKYGIDENGNPIEINDLNRNTIKAFILEKDNKNNYLIDNQGNILQKNENNDYYYKNGEELIIIKDFDVQHPELRIYGHRKIDFNEIKQNFEENILKEKINKNSSFIFSNKKEKINENSKTDINNIVENTPLNNNDNVNKNRSVIIEKKLNEENLKIFKSPEINIGNDNFKNQMNLWRKRYGKNNDFIENKTETKEIIINKIPKRKISYSNNNRANTSSRIEKNDLINRTDSILKMTSSSSNKEKYILPPKYKKLIKQKINKGLLYNRNYSYININDNNYKTKIKEKKENNNYQRNKTLEYINTKYNNFSTDLNNEEDKIKRANLIKSIKEKYNFKIKNNRNNRENEENKDENKQIKIDNYIYSNLKRINYMKKNKIIKCSVLKTDVSEIISNFNKSQRNIENIKGKNQEDDEIPLNKKGERLYFEYGNESDIIFKKIKLIPSKIKKNKLEIYNNNFQTNNSIIKLNNNIYYRKIKHNKY